MDPFVAPASPAAPAHEERRQRRQDPWSRALRYIVMATNVLLVVNVIAFLWIASVDYNEVVAVKVAGAPAAGPIPLAYQVDAPGQTPAAPAGQEPVAHPGRDIHRRAFVPIMGVGIFIGVAGILIDRKRTRRRRDRSYKGQLACIIVSAIGLISYLIIR